MASAAEDMPEVVSLSPVESCISHLGRSKLESDILAIAASDGVQAAVHERVSASDAAPSGLKQSAIKTTGTTESLRLQFEKGVGAILKAAGDRRLETLHEVLNRSVKEGTASEIVDWLFIEAEHQSVEADAEDAELVAMIFGVGTNGC